MVSWRHLEALLDLTPKVWMWRLFPFTNPLKTDMAMETHNLQMVGFTMVFPLSSLVFVGFLFFFHLICRDHLVEVV